MWPDVAGENARSSPGECLFERAPSAVRVGHRRRFMGLCRPSVVRRNATIPKTGANRINPASRKNDKPSVSTTYYCLPIDLNNEWCR
jgi:hypothetical protein